MTPDLEEIKTGYFKNEKNQYGSRRYVTNAQMKEESQNKSRVGWVILLVILVIVITAGYFAMRNMSIDRDASVQNAEYLPDEPSKSTVDSAPGMIPEYSGNNSILLNDNQPNFTEFDYSHISGENYSELDSLGRCGTATAMIDRSMMPIADRDSIGEVKPSGWKQEKYPGIIDSQPPYLYNRCHLIAYALTGQNANDKNLITGTRFLNVELMLPYEIQVAQYLDNSDNHVLYRVSPYFKENELLARGIEIEAYSVEDEGEGVCFHVFLYNLQPGVNIEYATGKSTLAN